MRVTTQQQVEEYEADKKWEEFDEIWQRWAMRSFYVWIMVRASQWLDELARRRERERFE